MRSEHDHYFRCEGCLNHFKLGDLRHRQNEKGCFCVECSKREKCPACGDISHINGMIYAEDIKKYVCWDCRNSYKEVINIINRGK